MQTFLQPVNRFLTRTDRPRRQAHAPGGGGAADGHLFSAAVEPDDVRAAVPGRAAARHLFLHARRRQQRAGRQGDQRPQSLHRHAGPGERIVHRVQVDAVRDRRARPADPARCGARHRRGARRRDDAVRLLRRLLAVVVRLQALSLRTRSGADGGRAGAAVHAADVRRPARSPTSRSIRIRGPPPTRWPASSFCSCRRWPWTWWDDRRSQRSVTAP